MIYVCETYNNFYCWSKWFSRISTPLAKVFLKWSIKFSHLENSLFFNVNIHICEFHNATNYIWSNWFAYRQWINYFLIWYLKHLVDKLMVNDNVFPLDICLDMPISVLNPCSKKLFKEWNFQISPLNLEKSFIANCLGPSKFHGSSSNLLHDLFNFLYIYNPTIF
jgi:hypothetical protein